MMEGGGGGDEGEGSYRETVEAKIHFIVEIQV